MQVLRAKGLEELAFGRRHLEANLRIGEQIVGGSFTSAASTNRAALSSEIMMLARSAAWTDSTSSHSSSSACARSSPAWPRRPGRGCAAGEAAVRWRGRRTRRPRKTGSRLPNRAAAAALAPPLASSWTPSVEVNCMPDLPGGHLDIARDAELGEGSDARNRPPSRTPMSPTSTGSAGSQDAKKPRLPCISSR